MPRRARSLTHYTPADAMRAAMRGMTRALATAPPEQAGALAAKLSALARELAAEEERTAFNPEDSPEMRAQFAREIEAMIQQRTAERLADILDALNLDRALATAELQDAVHTRHWRP